MNNIRNILIAHRGESFDASENTLASVNLAWDKNVKAVEVDLRLSKDNKIVVIHDATTKRTGKKFSFVNRRTLQELKTLDVGGFKSEKWKGEKIPTLKEMLKTVPTGKKIILEIKCGPEIIPILKDEINKSGLKPEQVEIVGFNLSVISKVKQEIPAQIVLWNHELKNHWWRKTNDRFINKMIVRAKEKNIDGLSLGVRRTISEKLILLVKSAGLKIYLWTIDDPAAAKIYFETGVDGIITNRAALFAEKLL